MSIEQSDRDAAAVAVAPRVALDDIKTAIASEFYFTGGDAARAFDAETAREAKSSPLDPLTICIMTMKNGFSVIGKSAPASPENFNAELGRKFAYEDCIRQLWPLMGFNLRERLYWQSMPQAQQTGA
jgi:hypothetical protein